MLEHIIAGIIQGICEWLPVSSSGVVALVKKSFFNSPLSIEEMSRENLFLHFGTFLAAFFYLRAEVLLIFKNIIKYPSAKTEDKNLIKFLTISTMISGTLGLVLLKMITFLQMQLDLTGKFATGVIGILLLITASIELKSKKNGHKKLENIKTSDSIILGIAQGFAVLPGLSRSGITIASLLLRKFDKTMAIKLSFLMSLPIVFAGNILLNFHEFKFSAKALVGLTASFLFGLLTMHILIKLSQKFNFGYFILFFGLLTLSSTLF